MTDPQKDFDLLDIPCEGVAAYWLSLKKLIGNKRNFKGIAEEAEYTSEPFIRFLLEIAFSRYSEQRIRMLAEAKQRTLLTEVSRRFNLMRICILDVATGENPHRTLAKLEAQFVEPPVTDEKAIHLAQELVKVVSEKPQGAERYIAVGHKTQDDKLLVTLLFYVMLARHEGKMACQPWLPYISLRYFRDGLAMVADGFDAPFVRKWLKEHQLVLLEAAEHKMKMSLELALAIARKEDYEDIFVLAQSYMR